MRFAFWKTATEPQEHWVPVDGMFKNWKFDHYTAEFGRFSLWIPNGFDNFRDYSGCGGRSEPFLEGMSRPRRKAIHDELLREIQRRSEAAIAGMVGGEKTSS